MTDTTRCKARIYGGGYFPTTCSRPATIEGYCKQHYPPNVKARQAANNAKWQAEYEAKMAVRKAADDARAALVRDARRWRIVEQLHPDLARTIIEGDKA